MVFFFWEVLPYLLKSVWTVIDKKVNAETKSRLPGQNSGKITLDCVIWALCYCVKFAKWKQKFFLHLQFLDSKIIPARWRFPVWFQIKEHFNYNIVILLPLWVFCAFWMNYEWKTGLIQWYYDKCLMNAILFHRYYHIIPVLQYDIIIFA